MKIDIQIDEKYSEETILIKAPKVSDELKEIINILNKSISSKQIYGKINDRTYPIDFDKVINIFIENKEVIIRNENNQKFVVNMKLYQLEEELGFKFVRISKSEIINIDYIDNLKMDNNGMIEIYFKDNSFTFSSRSYLKNIKERLKLWKNLYMDFVVE